MFFQLIKVCKFFLQHPELIKIFMMCYLKIHYNLLQIRYIKHPYFCFSLNIIQEENVENNLSFLICHWYETLMGFEISKYKKKRYIKKKKKLDAGTKVQRRKMRDQNDFRLLGYQICLGISQLREIEEICFTYKQVVV